MHMVDKEIPGLTESLKRLSPERRRAVAVSACWMASRSIDDLGDEALAVLRKLAAGDALRGSEVRILRDLANKADECYFQLKEAGMPKAEWAAWFCKARLLTAMANASQIGSWKDAADALYEVLFSHEDLLSVASFVESEVASALRSNDGNEVGS